MNESRVGASVEARRRGLLIIWGAQFLTIAIFLALTYVIRRGLNSSGNHTLAWALGAVGFMTFLASFLVKRKLLARAVAERRLDIGTSAYIVAFAACEMTAILGFVAYIITGLSYALHSFIIATGGLLMHFPARGALDEIEAGRSNANANLNQTTL